MSFPSTDLPTLSNKDDEQAVRKSVLDLLDKINNTLDQLTITSGSNANGNWVKYPDGTMIQGGSSANFTINGGPVGAFYIVSYSVTFPIKFYTMPWSVEVSHSRVSNGGISLCYFNDASITASGFAGDLASSQINAVSKAVWFAIGRWKA